MTSTGVRSGSRPTEGDTGKGYDAPPSFVESLPPGSALGGKVLYDCSSIHWCGLWRHLSSSLLCRPRVEHFSGLSRRPPPSSPEGSPSRPGDLREPCCLAEAAGSPPAPREAAQTAVIPTLLSLRAFAILLGTPLLVPLSLPWASPSLSPSARTGLWCPPRTRELDVLGQTPGSFPSSPPPGHRTSA